MTKPRFTQTRIRTLALALLAISTGTITLAQTPAAPAGGVAVVSTPGKASAARALEVSASVVGIDKATRTLTLKGPKGEVVDLVAGDEVRNFDQIKVGDSVVARYMQALTLELKKTKGVVGATMSEDAVRAKPGERPAVAGARQVTVIADVVAVDPKASTITVKGPKGNLVTLDVQNPDQFKVVKKGDQIEATYTEALALSVEPAPKAAAK
jgi:ribosomal protein L6P/L9E